uniref:Uncharacterized protein n=1 Tax=Rhodnius prolixus TaxID=13249 RepID=A0A4P6DAP5_RHOPR
MANELIILIGDNVTLKVRVEDHEKSFDHQWLHLLTAFIIVLCTLLLLLTILAVYLCSPETKPSNSKLTTLVNLLVTASYSECLFGRTLSLVFAIIYVNTPPHQILCRLSTASSIFFALITSLSINGIAMPKIFRTSLSMWMLLVLAIALTFPFFFIPTSEAVTYFFNRNDCQVFGKAAVYYILAITIFVFIPSWIGMINFLITYKFIKCRSNYLGIDDLRNTDGRFVVLLILLYILLVIPNIISIIIDELITYNEIIVIKDLKLRSITSWLSIVFCFHGHVCYCICIRQLEQLLRLYYQTVGV